MPAQTDRHFWERVAVGWHLIFAAMMVAVTGAAWLGGDLSSRRLALLLALAAAWTVSYVVLAAPAIGGRCDPVRARVYVGTAIVLFWGIEAIDPVANFALFILIPQIFALIDPIALAAGVLGVLMAGFAGILIRQVADGVGQAASILVSVGLSFAFSVVIGLWINGIITQSGKRAALIDDLQQARAELAVVNHERGVLAERERLSREIHDTLAQGFTSIVMLLEAADAEVGRDDDRARRHLALAELAARDSLSEARSLVAALSPSLAGGSLTDAVRRVARRSAAELGIPVEVTVTGIPRRLPAATEVVVLRATQEALANVAKHAAASRADLALDYPAGDGGVVLRVVDDGCGFDPALATGYGLAGMRARAEEAGGTVAVHSRTGAGATLTVVLP